MSAERHSKADRLGQKTYVSERKTKQAVVPASHLGSELTAHCFVGGHPGEIKCIWRGFGLAVDRHHEGQTHGVLARVMKTRNLRVREVFSHGKRRWIRGKSRKGQRTEVLFQMPE